MKNILNNEFDLLNFPENMKEFSEHQDACNYAKANPGFIVLRNGQNWIVKDPKKATKTTTNINVDISENSKEKQQHKESSLGKQIEKKQPSDSGADAYQKYIDSIKRSEMEEKWLQETAYIANSLSSRSVLDPKRSHKHKIVRRPGPYNRGPYPPGAF